MMNGNNPIKRDSASNYETLTEEELTRYSRQISIPGFGEAGQMRLKNARVAIAGAGGLGSAVALYLAAAGIGHIKILDDDAVELSNLNRQILYWESDIGKEKAVSAEKKLREINPYIEVRGVRNKITEENAVELLEDVNAVVDCLDNFSTRYIINDASIELGIPLFHGACMEFGGQVTTIIPKKTACLKCIFPRGPPHKKAPILGAVAGTIGAIQATEVVKFFAGMESLLTNKLLIYDGRFISYEIIELERNEDCPSCGGLHEG